MASSVNPPPPQSEPNGSLMSSASSSASASSPPPAKRRRTATGISDCCRTCRLRKVKCTGNPGNGPCTNCARLELACPFANPETTGDTDGKVSRTIPSHSHTEAGTLRKRAQRACSQCHAHKTKCSGGLPRCKRCEASGLSCEYTPARRKFANVRVNSPASQSEERSSTPLVATRTVAGPVVNSNNDDGTFPLMINTINFDSEKLLSRKNLILQHMDAYFEYVYYMPSMGFFHPTTAYQQIHDGTFEPSTAAAVCSVASFFVNPGDAGREFGLKCADEVEFYIFRNIYRFAEETLLLYALNGVFHFLNGSFAKVWQCFGIAIRLMIGLHVNWDVVSKNRTFVQQECLRRICWQFFHMDRLLAGGYEEYISCRVDLMKIRLPCNEQAFRDGRTIVSERLHDKPGKNRGTMGIHGYHLRLADIRHRILVLTKKLSASGPSRPNMEPSKVMADINGLQNELSRFNASLPDEFKLNDHNIARCMASEERVGYINLHIHLGSSHVDLYRTTLPGLQERIPSDMARKLPCEFISKSQKQTVAHALCLSRFIDIIQQDADRRPENGKLDISGDHTILNVATQCLRVLLIAMQYRFDQDLIDHTTAPLWRSEPADDAHIRRLIGRLLRVSETWSAVLPMARQMHENNKAAVEQFDKTQVYSDQKALHTNDNARANANGRLPGPHILEKAFTGAAEEEQRSKAGDAAAADRWFRTPQLYTDPVPYPLQEVGVDGQYGPPGVPVFLAHARGLDMGDPDALNIYDAATDLLSMSTTDKMVSMPNYSNVMVHPGSQQQQQQLLSPSSMSMIPMSSAGEMFQQQASSAPHAHFVPSQHPMFMEGYPGQYPDGQADATAYIPQTSFG